MAHARRLRASRSRLAVAILLMLSGMPGPSTSTRPSASMVPATSILDSPTLRAIRARGHLLVGTTGDYAPFSWTTADDGFEGFDIDAARDLAATLGVEARFVETSWPTLAADLDAGRFDIGMSGITRTAARAGRAALSAAYLSIGKVPLIRRTDASRFTSFEAIDVEGVRIGVNPGGTNEAFVRQRATRATIVVIPDNRKVPDAIERGEVDAMITDDVEARLLAARRPALAVVRPDRRLTEETLGYLMRKDDTAWVAIIDEWLAAATRRGLFRDLERRWVAPAAPGLGR
jgi:cyclohexadienyl dehydratase